MSSLNLFNPLNIPNLLSPSRAHLEIQYAIFAIIFLSLLAYVAYEFFETSFMTIAIILILTFIFLAFLYFVLKNRDAVDEAVLMSDVSGLDKESTILTNRITATQSKLTNLQKGGKRDLAAENNAKRELRKAQMERMRLKRELGNYDDELVKDLQGIRLSNAANDVNESEATLAAIETRQKELSEEIAKEKEQGDVAFLNLKKVAVTKTETARLTAEESAKAGAAAVKADEAETAAEKDLEEKQKVEKDAKEANSEAVDAKNEADAAYKVFTDTGNENTKEGRKAKREQDAATAAAAAANTAKNDADRDTATAAAEKAKKVSEKGAAAKAAADTLRAAKATAEKAEEATTAVSNEIKTVENLEAKAKDPGATTQNIIDAAAARAKLQETVTVTAKQRVELDKLEKMQRDAENKLKRARILAEEEGPSDVKEAEITLSLTQRKMKEEQDEIDRINNKKEEEEERYEYGIAQLNKEWARSPENSERRKQLEQEEKRLQEDRGKEEIAANEAILDLQRSRSELSKEGEKVYDKFKGKFEAKERSDYLRGVKDGYDKESAGKNEKARRLAAYNSLPPTSPLKARLGSEIYKNYGSTGAPGDMRKDYAQLKTNLTADQEAETEALVKAKVLNAARDGTGKTAAVYGAMGRLKLGDAVGTIDSILRKNKSTKLLKDTTNLVTTRNQIQAAIDAKDKEAAWIPGKVVGGAVVGGWRGVKWGKALIDAGDSGTGGGGGADAAGGVSA